MFNSEVRQMLVEVIRSWQVIAVTIFIIFYIIIINKVSKIQTIGRSSSKKRKPKKEKTDVPPPSTDDDLGLEEEGAEDSKNPDDVYVE